MKNKTELEKKFYEYLETNCVHFGKFPESKDKWDIPQEAAAHDLAEIVEKEYERINNTRKSSINYSVKLQKENTELKKQIENIKYLDYGEVKKMLLNHILTKEEPDEINISFRSKVDGKKYGIITSIHDLAVHICNLAIPITKEKIIRVLKDYYFEDEEDIKLFNKMANEILGDDNENK